MCAGQNNSQAEAGIGAEVFARRSLCWGPAVVAAEARSSPASCVAAGGWAVLPGGLLALGCQHGRRV